MVGSLCLAILTVSACGGSDVTVDPTRALALPTLERTQIAVMPPDTETFTALEQAETSLGWPLLRSTDGRFSFDPLTATYLRENNTRVGARTPYYVNLRDRLILTQALESHALPQPSGETHTVRMGSFDVVVWTRSDGSFAGTFETGAVVNGEAIIAFVNTEDEDQMREFLETLTLGG